MVTFSKQHYVSVKSFQNGFEKQKTTTKNNKQQQQQNKNKKRKEHYTGVGIIPQRDFERGRGWGWAGEVGVRLAYKVPTVYIAIDFIKKTADALAKPGTFLTSTQQIDFFF